MPRRSSLQAFLALASRGTNLWLDQHASTAGAQTLPALSCQLLSRSLSAQAQPDDGAASPTPMPRLTSRLRSVVQDPNLRTSGNKKAQSIRQDGQHNAGTGGRSLSPRMEHFSQGFFQYLNTDDSAPNAVPDKLASISALVELMKRGISSVNPQVLQLQQTGPGRGFLVAQGEAAGSVQLPLDYVASLALYRAALETLARLHRLPVFPWGPSRRQATDDSSSTTLHMPLTASTAGSLAQDLDVLLYAMEATPRINMQTIHYNQLLCALRIAGYDAAVESLYLRMDKGLKGVDARPDLESASEWLRAHSKREAPDVPGMLRVCRHLASSQYLRTQHSMGYPRLLSYALSNTLKAAVQTGAWAQVTEVLSVHKELSEQPIGAEVALPSFALSTVMAEAAEDDKLPVAIQAWEMLSQQHKQPQVEEGVYDAMLRAAARCENKEQGATVARKMFTALCQNLSWQEQRAAANRDSVSGDTTSQTTDPVLYKPGPAAYLAYIHALSRVSDWDSVFSAMSDLETHHRAAHPMALSPMHGLAPLAQALQSTPGAVRAAYQVLLNRQLRQQSVTNHQMDVILRAMALGGDDEAVAKLFEEYPTAGLEHTRDSYHAVMEACVVSGQPGKAVGVMTYMTSQKLTPNTDSYDLLIRSQLAGQDLQGACDTLVQLRKQRGVMAKLSTMLMAQALAKHKGDGKSWSTFAAEVEFLQVAGRYDTSAQGLLWDSKPAEDKAPKY